jgi:hypothetical protein
MATKGLAAITSEIDWENVMGLPSVTSAVFLIAESFWLVEELDGPAVSALRRVIAEVKQRWSVIGDQKIIISSSSVLRKVR